MANLVLVLIGLAAGVLAGIFGIGGGILIVPALVLVAKYPPQIAAGTSLAALVLPVGALGAWAYYKEGNVRIVPALIIGLGLFVGAYLGSRIGQGISGIALRRSFAVFLVLVAARMWFSR